jgi:hypothetical protein
MKLQRASLNSSEGIDLFEEALNSLGAVCERTWHNRLNVLAEGPVARLWNSDGNFHEVELEFVPRDATEARNVDRQVFAGCPLSFKLPEMLRAGPLVLEKIYLDDGTPLRAPDSAVAEKHWRAMYPDTKVWRLRSPLTTDWHFGLILLARCEIQAIDQRWTVHRVALSLTDGVEDVDLAERIAFQKAGLPPTDLMWPAIQPKSCELWLNEILKRELSEELASVRLRQESSLQRELDRIDDYFDQYEEDLSARAQRSRAENTKAKLDQRLSAAKADRARRRKDQIARHEIRVIPHVDAALLTAEKAWRGRIQLDSAGHDLEEALYLPRSRQWRRNVPSPEN